MKRIYARFNLVGNNYLIENYKIVNDSKEFRELQVNALRKRGEAIEDIHASQFTDNESNELILGRIDGNSKNRKPKRKFRILSYNEVAEEIKHTYQFMIEQDLDELKQEWLNYKE